AAGDSPSADSWSRAEVGLDDVRDHGHAMAGEADRLGELVHRELSSSTADVDGDHATAHDQDVELACRLDGRRIPIRGMAPPAHLARVDDRHASSARPNGRGYFL